MTNLRKSTTILLALLAIDFSQGQTSPDPTGHMPPVAVSEVTFWGGLPVTNDDGGRMNEIHWIDKLDNSDPNVQFPDGLPDPDPGKPSPNNIKSYAYSYAANEEPIVSAAFKWNGEPQASRSPYYAEGKVVDSENSTFTLEKKESLDGHNSYILGKANSAIVDKIRIQAYLTENRKISRFNKNDLDWSEQNIRPLTIEWKVTDKDGNIAGLSRSSRTIYVTSERTALPELPMMETYLNVACVMANGLSPENDQHLIANRIFSEFEDLEVRRMDNQIIGYWRHANTFDTSSQVMIMEADGQCGAFCELLIKCLACGGVNANRLEIKPVGDTGTRMLIKNWTFLDGSLPLPWTHRFVDPANVNYMGPPTEVVPTPDGVKAQGDINPALKKFLRHFVVEHNKMIFDPSYGIKIPALVHQDPEIENTDSDTYTIDSQGWEKFSLDGLQTVLAVLELPSGVERNVAVAKPINNGEASTTIK